MKHTALYRKQNKSEVKLFKDIAHVILGILPENREKINRLKEFCKCKRR